MKPEPLDIPNHLPVEEQLQQMTEAALAYLEAFSPERLAFLMVTLEDTAMNNLTTDLRLDMHDAALLYQCLCSVGLLLEMSEKEAKDVPKKN